MTQCCVLRVRLPVSSGRLACVNFILIQHLWRHLFRLFCVSAALTFSISMVLECCWILIVCWLHLDMKFLVAWSILILPCNYIPLHGRRFELFWVSNVFILVLNVWRTDKLKRCDNNFICLFFLQVDLSAHNFVLILKLWNIK